MDWIYLVMILEGTILKIFSPRSIQFSKKREGTEVFRIHPSLDESYVREMIGKNVSITVEDNQLVSISPI